MRCLKMTFAEKILNFRAEYDLTQKQLSKILGVSLLMVYKYESVLSKPSPKNKIRFEKKIKEWEEKQK